MGNYALGSSSKRNMEGVDMRLKEIAHLAITLTVIDFGIPSTGGKRTAEVQNGLFVEDKSDCDGYDKISEHQLGNALDFYAYAHGKASWEPHYLAIIGCAFLQAASILGYKLEWGGLWQRRTPKYINGIPYGWDMPHTQLMAD